MSRIPVLERDKMDAEQQRVHDEISATTTGRVGHGPAIGFAYSPGLWECHNTTSKHQANCSLTPSQVRIASLMTVRHWNAAYPAPGNVEIDPYTRQLDNLAAALDGQANTLANFRSALATQELIESILSS